MSKKLEQAAAVLSRSRSFAGVKAEDLPAFLADLKATVTSFAADDVVMAAGAPVTAIRAVIAGEVQMTEEDVFGNRTIFGSARPGDLFGEALAISGVQEGFVTVVAVSDATVLSIEVSEILRDGGAFAQQRQALERNLMQTMARRNMQLHQKLACLQCRRTRDKVLTYLGSVSRQRHATTFSIPMSRQELADFLCVDRSALSTELGKMRAEGLIDFEHNTFKLLV